MSYQHASRNKWSLLLDLPLELRLHVYGFCFPVEWIDLTVIGWDGPIITDELDRPVQLLRTCRAIRIEAEPILRRNSIFVSDTRFLTTYQQPPAFLEHLEIELDTDDVESLHECSLSVPQMIKSLQLIYRPDDDYCIDERWNSLRREAVILFADSVNFNVLEDFSEGSEEIVFGMRYEQKLLGLKNRGKVIMLKPDIGTYHGTVS